MPRLSIALALSSLFLIGARAQEQPLAATIAPGAATTAAFEIKEGDRVAFLGDALLERENSYGFLEARLHAQFRDRTFSVRNLSWSGDTPAGWSRASFDSPDKGLERLKEHLALVKPTVVFLGYGMAASLQEVTDRAQDPTLNPDPARYGAEPMTAARFKKELGALMDLVDREAKAAGTAPVRFVLLSPIRHEALRKAAFPAANLPDAAKHNDLLVQYSRAIEEIAKERGAPFVNLAADLGSPKRPNATQFGIQLTKDGYEELPAIIARGLAWEAPATAKEKDSGKGAKDAALRAAIFRKNDLFFHRFRPANSTYLFGFRKHEQGQNAKEMAEFDPLLAAADAEIDRIKRGSATAPVANNELKSPAPASPAPAVAPLPLPQFDVDPSLEITLWAQTPMLGKPTQMSWDSEGRLWVACTPIYPQIRPGAHPDDKVVILEDTDRDGKADKSTVFADDLLIPSGVAVELAMRESPSDKDVARAKSPSQRTHHAYVGASTELLHLTDTDGDGKADERRVVLSGFGTEDTHHTLHTLRWGPDGRLYFNQSVYIHSHLETPWGLVRLNAGGVFAYEPATERVEVISKGLWNTWGHAWDKSGQSFLTDGAGSNGISWAFPGAVFNPSEGARKTMPSITPGSYPKFAGLEIIRSPLFPADWQGTAVTCDFRAHRVVRFAIDDLSSVEKARSGYVTRDLPDVARTPDLAFRPIDIRHGPDGALYIADWTNPVINHGEVDFRDQRRDHVHGRIWRVAPKGSTPLKWGSLAKKAPAAAKDSLKSESLWEREQAGRLVALGGSESSGGFAEESESGDLAKLMADPNPRVRLQAMRRATLTPSSANTQLILEAALNAPPDDPHYEFAAWTSINDLAAVWTEALAKGEWKADTDAKQKQLTWALGAIRPELASGAISKLLAAGQVPLDGSGPWIELIGQAGDATSLGLVFDALVREQIKGEATVRALRALGDASRKRGVRPTSELKDIAAFFHKPDAAVASAALRAAGPWQIRGFIPLYAQQARSEQSAVRDAALEALRDTGASSPEARSTASAALSDLCADSQPPVLRRRAAAALAALDLKGSLTVVVDVLTDQIAEADALETWRGLLSSQGAPDTLATTLPRNLSPVVAAAGLRAARELGKKGEKLTAFLTQLSGLAPTSGLQAQDWKAMGEFVKRDGDPGRGEEIYRRTALACVACHAIGGAGGKVGPELGTIGASAPLDYIIESVLAPTAKVKEGYHAVSLTTKDGAVAAGVLARETDKDLIVRTATGQEQSVPKANVTARENIGSLMPAGLVDSLKDRERLDLMAFLAQLGKAGTYDSSKSTVARTWWLYSKASAEAAGVGALKGGDGIPAHANVDGALPKERLGELAAMVQGDALFAVAKFHAATAGKAVLNLQGVREAWLDGQPLPVASEPSPRVDLSAGDHVLAVKLESAQLPGALRAASDAARFIQD